MMFLKSLLKKLKTIKLEPVLSGLACLILGFYKSYLSGTLGSGGCCRFYPSCGDYALLAYKKYSFLKATKLTLFRILKCQPFGPKWANEPSMES